MCWKGLPQTLTGFSEGLSFVWFPRGFPMVFCLESWCRRWCRLNARWMRAVEVFRSSSGSLALTWIGYVASIIPISTVPVWLWENCSTDATNFVIAYNCRPCKNGWCMFGIIPKKSTSKTHTLFRKAIEALLYASRFAEIYFGNGGNKLTATLFAWCWRSCAELCNHFQVTTTAFLMPSGQRGAFRCMIQAI